jgi:hypothetical protein
MVYSEFEAHRRRELWHLLLASLTTVQLREPRLVELLCLETELLWGELAVGFPA